MGAVDLVSRIITSYNSQGLGVKRYRKLADFFLELSVCNSFIIVKKLNTENNTMTRLLFTQAFIEELIQSPSYS